MKKELACIAAVFCVLAFVGSASADLLPGFQYVIMYDGLVESDGVNVLADTLIVVTNPNPGSLLVVHMDVFDKYGTLVWHGDLLDGGSPVTGAPPNGYVWTTLGMVIGRPTYNPFAALGPEKLTFRISARHTDGTLRLTPVVEVKQVLYSTPVDPHAIWESNQFSLIRTWTETSLGGNAGTGVIWP